MLEIKHGAVWYGSNGVVLGAFPELLRLHLERTRGTVELEMRARDLAAAGFAPAYLEAFVRDVCTWGGYSGIAGRVLGNNSTAELAARFRHAHMELAADRLGHENVGAALRELNRIKGLGTPSFASKHLRFLSPEQCPILDRLIATTCGYPFSVAGYERYAQDCAAIARVLEEEGIGSSFPGSPGDWRAADVDAAVFASIRVWG